MMLKSCEEQNHDIKVTTDDTGYDELCLTCGDHAHLCNPLKPKPKKVYLYVLDFTTGKAFQYKLLVKNDYDYEKFITDNGHSIKNCEWMVSEHEVIIVD